MNSLVSVCDEIFRDSLLHNSYSCRQSYRVENRYKEYETVFVKCDKVQLWNVNTVLNMKRSLNFLTKTVAT